MNDMVARVAESLFSRELDMKEAALYETYRRLEAAGCARVVRKDVLTDDQGRCYIMTQQGLKKRKPGARAWRRKKQTSGLQEG